MLTPEELASIKATVSPGQRRHRLLCPLPDAEQSASADSNSQQFKRRRASHKGEPDLKFSVLRVAIRDEAEAGAILALSVPERRRRLLKPPAYGDPCDDRPGRWRR
jgi:hypothetical protein